MLILWEGKSIHKPFTGEVRLSELLRQCGVLLTLPCGGAHTCGKCRVRAIGELSPPSGAEQALLGENALQNHIRLACETMVLGDQVTVFVDGEAFDDTVFFSEAPPCEADEDSDGYGMAVDIGTTTVEASFHRLSDGAFCFSRRVPNEQRSFGSDVITRIGAASDGQLSDLQKRIADQLEEIRRSFPLPVRREVVVGNTVMLHLLKGIDPAPMGQYPYPVPDRFGRWEGSRYLGRCPSAFVGADAVAAAAACGLDREESALLVDLGTNGEIVLSQDGHLLCTSTAAGPALEGGGIACGMPAFAGAIKGVSLNGDGSLLLETVKDAPAKGLCGSGLVDALACLLAIGAVDKSGYLEADYPLCQGQNGTAIALTPEDIRSLQLAKGAIRTGIDLLLREAGVKEKDVKHLYLAGNFGSSLRLGSCYAIGLLPFFKNAEVKQVGNAALRGAVGMLVSEAFLKKSEEIAASLETVDLSAKEDFDEWFVKNLPFI